jgi:hypothetical protein
MRWAVPQSLGLVASGGVMLLWGAPSASATTWDFYETSCTGPLPGSGGIGCLPEIGYPAEVGQLTLPSDTAGGSYTLTNNLGVLTQTGDMDFLFRFGSDVVPGTSSCTDPTAPCNWNITFSSSPTELDGTFDFFGQFDAFDIVASGTNWEGPVASDGTLAGCEESQCAVSGYLTTVPEPSSLASLVSALFGVYLFLAGRRIEMTPRRGMAS